jgi:RNA polymerase-binding transcription factor DksA
MGEPSVVPPAAGNQTTSRDRAIDEARTVLAEAETELNAIEQAIERLERGTYFTCELCGAPIEPDRFVAAPTERYCAAHGAPG